MMLAHRHPIGHSRAGGRRQERGAALIEAAIVLPIFFTLVLGVIDLGLGVLQTSQATGAAADGARVGVLRHEEADVLGTPDHEAVVEAIEGRLVGQEVDDITVSCLTSSESGGAADAISCASADPDTAFLRVELSWRFRPISPVGHGLPVQDIRGTATMAIVRQPTASDP